jgi:hypothetical protein
VHLARDPKTLLLDAALGLELAVSLCATKALVHLRHPRAATPKRLSQKQHRCGERRLE